MAVTEAEVAAVVAAPIVSIFFSVVVIGGGVVVLVANFKHPAPVPWPSERTLVLQRMSKPARFSIIVIFSFVFLATYSSSACPGLPDIVADHRW